MPRSIVAASALLFSALLSLPAGLGASSEDASPVKLWVDTAADNQCEQATPASGDWMIRNNENRNVHVVVHRVTTKGGATTEDQMRDTLGPRETRELGCETSDDSHQTLTVMKVTF